jgi:hypothetical protein
MPGLQLPIADVKKELTNMLNRLKLVGNMNGEIVIRVSAGSVCGFERKELFK